MTNKELYNFWQNNKAKLIEISQADWDIEWEKPASNASHEAIIEYQGVQYCLFFQDDFDEHGNLTAIIDLPNEQAGKYTFIDTSKTCMDNFITLNKNKDYPF